MAAESTLTTMSQGSSPSQASSGSSTLSSGAKHRKALLIAFCMTTSYMVAEIIGGLATGSLALLSDAAHMGTDVVGIGMAVAAVYLASRPAPRQRTYGTYRIEVLAALANAVLLFAVAIYILYEAYQRLREPQEVSSITVLVVAAIGLAVNLVSFKLLREGAGESLNVKGAYLEVISDMLGSIGVIAAAAIIYLTGWTYADPIIAAGIGLFILPRTYQLGAQAVRILLEVAPPNVDVATVEARIQNLPGVESVHDLHIWTLTSGIEAASAHIAVSAGTEPSEAVARVTELLSNEYGVAHATIQPDAKEHPNTTGPI